MNIIWSASLATPASSTGFNTEITSGGSASKKDNMERLYKIKNNKSIMQLQHVPNMKRNVSLRRA